MTNETTSLVTGEDTLEQPPRHWQIKAAAVGVFALFTACLLFSAASNNQPRAVVAEPKFELSLEQKIQLRDQWKGYLSWQDTWYQAQDQVEEAWNQAHKEAEDAWNHAKNQGEEVWKDAQEKGEEAWQEAQDAWGKTNLTELFDPENVKNHAHIWTDQTLEEGKNWWDKAQDYFNHLDSAMIQHRLFTHHRHYRQAHKEIEEEPSLVYMNHSAAFDLLLSHGGLDKYAMDYFLLNQGLDAQINQAYCAVASSMAVLNSLRGIIDLPQDKIYSPYPYATQVDAFNECTNANVIVQNETFDGIFSAPGGLSLASARNLLECHLPADRWNVEAFHVDVTITPGDMRGAMKDALKNPNSRVIINYHRAIAGQVGGGHFSPIGAYSPKMDAFLIMDVAKYKYAPVWIPTDLLYSSLFATDSCGNWNGPAAQTALPPQLLHPESITDLAAAMALLGCRAAPRGYIIVSKKR